MIKDKLAKQLMEAGFPFKRFEVFASCKDEFCYCSMCGCPVITINDERYYYPPLEVLIEACGAEILGLNQYKNGKILQGWAALYFKPLQSAPAYLEGSTPEEAVAKLWIKLNKQK